MMTFNTLLLLLSVALVPIGAIAQNQIEISKILMDCDSAEQSVVFNHLQKLKSFPASDFTQEHKMIMYKYMITNPPHLEKWILLAGFLGMKNELFQLYDETNINSLFSQISKSKSLKNAYKLALVRAGDPQKLDNLIRNAQKMQLNDDFVFDVAPKIAFVRQKKAMDLLLDLILKRGTPCTPADAETKGKISCAYRLIEVVGPCIADFPIEIDPRFGFESDNYEKDLEKCRKWIKKNKNNYTLITETY